MVLLTLLALTGVQTLPGRPADAAGPVLPFDPPSTASLRSSPKLVFAHYFTPLPISIDNEPSSTDYYARNYLTPGGEKGKHAAYGGYLRDRPLTRPVSSDPAWRLADMKTEVRQAVSAGIDGFTLDLLALPGSSNVQVADNTRLMLQAAEAVDPGFKLMLMPDLTGSMADRSVAELAAGVAAYGRSKAAYHLPDGRLVVSPVMAEAHSASWWSSFMSTMKNSHGTPVALLPVFIAHEEDYLSSFAPISWGMSIWGSRNPAWSDPTLTYATSPRGRAEKIKSLGMKWMQPVSVQDERPNQGVFDEANNTQNLRDTWQLARATDADFVQIPTWNDYGEGTQLAPSVKHGYAYLDIAAYYATWFKTGAAPRVARDAVYLTHRTQSVDAQPRYDQTLIMQRRGGSPARNTVEALTFLTAPATVVVNVGAKNYVCAAQVGVDVCTVPAGPGSISVKVRRSDRTVVGATSPWRITTDPYVQDLQYVAVGSLRSPSDGDNDVAGDSRTLVSRTVSVIADQDAYANAGAPSTNYGTTSTLSSRGQVAASSFLRFEVPPAPVGTSLTGARLQLHTSSDPASATRDTQYVRTASSSWSEGSLTWQSKPAASDTSIGTLASDLVADRTYSVPLSLAAARALPGGGRSFALSSSGSDETRFWSSEYSVLGERPVLVLTYTPVD